MRFLCAAALPRRRGGAVAASARPRRTGRLESPAGLAGRARRLSIPPHPRSEERSAPAGAGASDLELVRRVLAREPAAVEDFVQRMRCVPRILAALNQRFGRRLDEHDLADLAQDAAVLTWRKLETFRGDCTLETWAYGVAHLEFRNAHRRKGRARDRQVEAGAERAAEPGGTPGGEVLDRSEVDHWLAKLDREEATVIRLKHLSDLTFEEIGARLAISSNTAKTRYYRGIHSLQELTRSTAEEAP